MDYLVATKNDKLNQDILTKKITHAILLSVKLGLQSLTYLYVRYVKFEDSPFLREENSLRSPLPAPTAVFNCPVDFSISLTAQNP